MRWVSRIILLMLFLATLPVTWFIWLVVIGVIFTGLIVVSVGTIIENCI